METLVGFAVGFLVGTKEGKAGVARIRESWAAIRNSTQVRHLVGEAMTAAAPLMRDLARVTGGAA